MDMRIPGEKPVIRPMRPDEKQRVKRVAREAFGVVQGAFVKTTDHTFVYVISGDVVGAVVLDTFTYMGDRLGGVVKWLFTSPKAQGRGAAAALVEHGVDRLKELGCRELFTTIEGFNTPSSNRFFDLGFVSTGPLEQIRRYGVSVFKIGLNTFHTIDVGHFLWTRPADLPPADSPTENSPTENLPTEEPAARVGSIARPVSGGGPTAWWANVFITAAILALRWVRVGTGSALSHHLIWQLPAAITLVFGVRSLAMKLAARRTGVDLFYRAWETGLTLSALITVVFGGVFPSPGSYYPTSPRWSYRAELPRVAPVAAAGAGAVLALAWFLLAFQMAGLARVPVVINDVLALAVLPVQALLVFEILLPFFPFASFNGRRIRDHNRLLWALLVAGTVALFLVRI